MDPRRRARLILIVGVLLAVLAGVITYSIAEGAKSTTAEPPPTTDVLVAARDIPARTALGAADVKVAKIDVSVAPPAALKDPKDAVGKILQQPVAVNEPLIATKFAPVDRGFTVFPPGEQVQPGSPAYRVMTVTIPDQFAVGGVLQAGDIVDILYVYSFDPAKYVIPPTGGAAPAGPSKIAADTVAKVVVGPSIILARLLTVYTIRVDAALAERLAYAQAAGGTLQLLLRAPGDERAAGTTGATFQTTFDAFKLPIPQKIAAPQ
ncbi:MAG: Flp pilus assembly protein CpaB [Chloroflexi bacterium]|nr:Flp pilus assembly protein CpaB [Chloroflexota bacterium]